MSIDEAFKVRNDNFVVSYSNPLDCGPKSGKDIIWIALLVIIFQVSVCVCMCAFKKMT
jgi:hypothetical protein